jgi:hypothetical protein
MKIFWSNARYIVWSARVDQEDGVYVTRETVELRRTDRKVAEEDAALIRDTFRRKAWVQDAEEELDRRDEKTGKLLITGGKTCSLKK